MLPLSEPFLQGNELTYLKNCIETGWVSSAGAYVNRFEEMIGRYTGDLHAVAMSSGTAALHLALRLCQVGAEDEVVVPTITFIAPVNAVAYVEASPVFMDCDDSLNLDPEKLDTFLRGECEQTAVGLKNKKSGRRIRAIIVVHVFGHPVNIKPIHLLCRKFGLRLIEDATESLGSFYLGEKGERQHTGTIGDIGCLSFNGNKIITSGGGGMILTRDKKLADRARYLSTQAKDDPLYFRHDEIGYNYRLTNVQAAIGVAQMEQLEKFVEIKRRNFDKYREALTCFSSLRLLEEPAKCRSNYWHYALVVGKEGSRTRDGLLRFMLNKKIDCRPLWHPVHLQKPFRHCLTYRIEKAERYEEEVLNIPCSIGLTDGQIAAVTDTIRSYYGKN